MHRATLGILGVLAGCGVTDVVGDGPPDSGPDLPTIQVAYSGTYASSGTWDLSQPFGGDGVGGVVADLLIDKIIELAGVPSALESEARDLVAGAIRQQIVDEVNGAVPTELLASDPTMIALAAILADVANTGSITLAAGADPDIGSGSETVSSLAVTHEGDTIAISMPELLEGGVSVTGGFSGAAIGPTSLALTQHALEIRYGALVAIVARDALGVDAYALADQAMEATSCANLLDIVTGGDATYDLTVGGQDFSVAASELSPACEDLRTDLTDDALAMIRPDAGLRLGGSVGVTGSTVSSQAYGGAITLLPGPVEPLVTATFSATR